VLLYLHNLAAGQRRIEAQLAGLANSLKAPLNGASAEKIGTRKLEKKAASEKADSSGTWAKAAEGPKGQVSNNSINSMKAVVPAPTDEDTVEELIIKPPHKQERESTASYGSGSHDKETTLLQGFASVARHHNHPKLAEKISAISERWEHHAATKEPKKGPLYKFVTSHRFGLFCFAVIIVNSLVMVYISDKSVRLACEHKDMSKKEQNFWMGVDTAFLVWYIVELGLKFKVFGKAFLVGEDCGWNLFDCALVALGAFEVLNSVTETPVANVTFMRSMRIFKVSRVIRTTQALKCFQELRLLIDMVVCSALSLFWACVLLAFILFLFALFFVQSVTGYLLETDVSDDEIAALQKDFGSVFGAMFALLSAVTGGNDWMGYYELIEPCGQITRYLYTFFIIFFTLSVLNIVSSVFVDKALRLASPDAQAEIHEKQKEDMKNTQELLDMLRARVDQDGDGKLTLEEFHQSFDDDDVRTWLDMKGIAFKDMEQFFHMLAKHHGDEGEDTCVALNDFVDGIMRMKGQASAIDVHSIKYQVKCLKNSTDRFMGRMMKFLDQQPLQLQLPEK
jgi:hypothetical protein